MIDNVQAFITALRERGVQVNKSAEMGSKLAKCLSNYVVIPISFNA